MLGRGDLRCRHALPQGMPVGPPAAVARDDAQSPFADVASLSQCCGLQQLSRQRGGAFRRTGSRKRHRSFPSLRFSQLVENMKVAMNAVLKTGRILEAAICFTGDFLDPKRSKYDLDYYLRMARALEREGAHVLAIKDMAGLLKPEAARLLVKALKSEIKLPIHLHTHDTSGISAATILAAAQAGVDAVDAAIDSMTRTTPAQPLR